MWQARVRRLGIMNRRKLAITGSQGFIGKHLINHFSSANYEIFSLDVKNDDNEVYLFSKKEFLKELEFRIPKNTDFFIHCGAIASTFGISQNSLYFYNLEATKIIINFCSENSIPLVFFSSTATYGNQNKPLNDYAWSKAECEDLIRNSPIASKTIILRLSNVYGFDETKKGPMKSVISTFILSAIYNHSIEIWDIPGVASGGNQSRDFVYVTDLCKIVEYLIKERNLYGKTFDIGTGYSQKLKDIANQISIYFHKVNVNVVRPPIDYKVENYQIFTKANLEWSNNLVRFPEISKPSTNLLKMIEQYKALREN